MVVICVVPKIVLLCETWKVSAAFPLIPTPKSLQACTFVTCDQSHTAFGDTLSEMTSGDHCILIKYIYSTINKQYHNARFISNTYNTSMVLSADRTQMRTSLT